MAGKTTTRDMTNGPIVRQVIWFALPLMLGNVFQLLYNTVDSIVVGRYVSYQALAAIGATTMIVNMAVFFFNGFSVGAGVVISFYFGAKEMSQLHKAIETTMAATFILSAVFSIAGYFGVVPMLNMMSTPEDVMADATTYLHIYFAGISGLLIFNMVSGVLRAVGDSTRPLYFLIFSSILNIGLDLVFVLVFHLGIAGVGYATVLTQMLSAILAMTLLLRTKDLYRFTWSDMKIDGPILKRIVSLALPTGIQSVLTAFSNVFVQSYINAFDSSCMAGWSAYNKLDSFIMLPTQSLSMASTNFVSQNVGARQRKRANQGITITNMIAIFFTALIAAALYIFAEPAVGLFTKEEAVISYGALFLHTNIFLLLFNCVNHVLAGGIRGWGDSRGPMVLMLSTFVALRQCYLYIITHYFLNTPAVVGFGYPVGWMTCCVAEIIYYYCTKKRREEKALQAKIE